MLNKILKYIPLYAVFDSIRYLIVFLQIPFSFIRTFFVKPEIIKLNEYSNQHQFIYVYASIESEIGESSSNILSTIKALGGYIILVTNNKNYVFNEQAKLLCDLFIDNKNTGWDFGEYKQASKYIYSHLSNYSFNKVVYGNDSVFYLPSSLKEAVTKLLNEEYEYIGIFDGSERFYYHFGSWGFSLSKNIFLNDKVKGFWNRFFEIKNKFYAIRRGEFGFSKVIFSIHPKTYVIYSGEYINSLQHLNLSNIRYLGKQLLEDFFEERNFTYKTRDSNQDLLRDFISLNHANYPLAQTLAPLLIKFYEMPFLKKDMFWNEVQSLGSLSLVFSILDEKLNKNYSTFIKAYFLKRGRISTARFDIRMLTFLGIR